MPCARSRDDLDTTVLDSLPCRLDDVHLEDLAEEQLVAPPGAGRDDAPRGRVDEALLYYKPVRSFRAEKIPGTSTLNLQPQLTFILQLQPQVPRPCVEVGVDR